MTEHRERPATKECRVCGEKRPVSWFSRSKRGRDGLKSRCCACQAAAARHRNRRAVELAAKQSEGHHAGLARMAFEDFFGNGGLEAALEAAGMGDYALLAEDELEEAEE